MDDCKPIGLTMGDAAGIGPELIVKLFQQGINVPCVVYGDGFSLQRAIDLLGASSVRLQCFESIEAYGKSDCYRAYAQTTGQGGVNTTISAAEQSESCDSESATERKTVNTQGEQRERNIDRLIQAADVHRSAKTEPLAACGEVSQAQISQAPISQATIILPFINAGVALDEQVVYGQTSAQAGDAAFRFLVQAIDDALADKISAIVTAPLHKVSLKLAGHDYPGHTEILAERAGVEHVGMMLLNDELRVILATIHIALADVPAQITAENQRITIGLAQQALSLLGLPQGRIAVAGLNPHAGEEGRFGREEERVISPVIAELQAQGIRVSGPYPGDTIFMRARRGEFDIVVAQYHDQGLIPVKYLGVDEGVNVTVGLPFIRTSVDHGTAFDIAGQGIADPASLRAALDLAIKMLAQRQANLGEGA
ncbi:MAG: 4-hydroxythreonine-4-phosphate dehydrogenase PdxA [Pelistega sp.]|nr:4-hydroxythreonine-4-phosphate dehydrogenase PdxA [Pelistega sp.]